jgi:hypothetical protein
MKRCAQELVTLEAVSIMVKNMNSERKIASVILYKLTISSVPHFLIYSMMNIILTLMVVMGLNETSL